MDKVAEKEHISREAVTDKLTLLRDKCGNDEMAFALNWALRLMNDIPAADVEPVRHGKWIHGAGKLVPWDEMNPGCPNGSAYCSICGDWLTASDEYPAKGLFCPNCGAKMDGRDDNG